MDEEATFGSSSPNDAGHGVYEDEGDWSMPVDYETQATEDMWNKVDSFNTSSVSSCQQEMKPSQNSKLQHPKTIIHIDVDCFYAQVEMIHNPALRDIPLGVQQKYIVVTCNYPARAQGVGKLMSVAEAKKKCPELTLVSGEDLTNYRAMSYKVSEFLIKYTPNVERLGFDENYLDVTEMVEQRIQGNTASPQVVGHVFSGDSTPSVHQPCSCGCHHRLAVGSQIAADIRSALEIEVGITCCAGIGHNKLLAKLAGARHKPSQQTTVFPCQAEELVSAQCTAQAIPGIGHATSKRLASLGVVTVGDLRALPPSALQEEFGEVSGTTIHHLAHGRDDTKVVPYGKPQTLSIEDSFRCCNREEDARSRISQLISNLLPRAQEDGRSPQTFRLTVRKVRNEERYLPRESRQCSIPKSVAQKIAAGQLEVARDSLVAMAMTLFHKMVDVKRPFHLTLINTAFAKLEEGTSVTIASYFSSVPSPVKEQTSSCKQATQDDRTGPLSTPMKRKPVYSLTNFFTKKEKFGESVLSTESEMQEAITCESSRACKTEDVIRTELSDGQIPQGVDPDVFSQLPSDIQHELIQQSKMDSTNQLFTRGTGAEELSQSAEEFVEGHLCAQSKGNNNQLSQQSQCQKSNKSDILLQNLISNSAHEHSQKQSSLKDLSGLPQTKPSSVNYKIHESQDANSKAVLSSPGSCTVKEALMKPKIQTPKGVAADVFDALPPDIQQELAAEMAIQKHHMVSANTDRLHSSNAQTSTKKINSMLNYLKKI